MCECCTGVHLVVILFRLLLLVLFLVTIKVSTKHWIKGIAVHVQSVLSYCVCFVSQIDQQLVDHCTH